MTMKGLYLLAVGALLAGCSAQRHSALQNSLLVGTWVRPNANVTFELKNNGKYYYHFQDEDYSTKQSGNYRYFADNNSVVLYGFYPDAYTEESKNETWSILSLTADTLTVFAHKSVVILDGDTLNTAGNQTEIFIRK